MLKHIRKNPIINNIVRNSILLIQKLCTSLEKKWRLSGTIELKLDDYKFKMSSECDDGILEPLFYNRSYIELYDLRVFISLIKEGSVIIDIGANTGIYSIVSASVSDSSQIYSFEPDPVNYNRLKENVELNSFTNITIFQKAVGASNDTISFTVPEEDVISDTSSAIENFSKSSYEGEIKWKNIEVKQVSLDDFCDELNLEKVDLIKIDVEGYELSALKGSVKIIEKCKPTILIESFLEDEKRKYLEDFVVSNNYTIYLITKEGIIKTGKRFEENVGLNYLLMSYETKGVFTKIKKIGTLRDTA